MKEQKTMRIPTLVFAAALIAAPALAAKVDDANALAMTRPRELISGGVPAARLAALLRPVNAFYGFWTNGSPALLAQAAGADFTDHTLPLGRAQGLAGLRAASETDLTAVPDLKVTVVQRIVAGDRVVSHLRITGHFTGSFKGRPGAGQAVDFIATDILRVSAGRITDNWHLEDNLTFLRQVGVVAK
jgi:predicted ester cyclase